MQTGVTGSELNAEGGVTLSMEPAGGGKTSEMNFDVVLVSTGRRPFTGGLGLEVRPASQHYARMRACVCSR